MMPDPSSNRDASALLFLHAQTPMHPGSGTALGVVDLPVQRERHTQWPIIPGSSLKGVIRDACREQAKTRHDGKRKQANENDPDLVAAFGPGKVDDGTSHAGALSLTDARILAFPVRSLKGVFAWVTCPAVLTRLNRDLAIAGHQPIGKLPAFASAAQEVVACQERGPLLLEDEKMVLEEFEFTRSTNADEVADWVAGHAVADTDTQARVKSHLAVISDNDFGHFVRHATEVVARVGLDYERKTVKPGALFYQEFLPAETLFYSVVFASPSRKEEHAKTASDMLAFLDTALKNSPLLQIGGNESIGKGLCLARLIGKGGK